ncbi:hypothetical protein Tfer_2038 [Thermincola ferriacetica]|uniref:Uncharacterized protein n=1 Tax=Thermincola ferriacetica TaxID=281456 RepID=A0A0L6W2U4_9FIRM|nr:hypothetical protein [Thermincola ferriacetica]KNZ69399.1 hypothetical protein Tfer_2038 [Thermincola ferriacetica]
MKLKLVKAKSFTLWDASNRKLRKIINAGEVVDVPMNEAEYLLGTGLFTTDLEEPVYDPEEEDIREASEEANKAFQMYRKEALKG